MIRSNPCKFDVRQNILSRYQTNSPVTIYASVFELSANLSLYNS